MVRAAKASMRRLGILTGGGNAQAMNTCLYWAIRTAETAGVQMVGIRNGYNGLVKAPHARRGNFSPLKSFAVEKQTDHGGRTFLGSGRCPAFFEEAGRRLAFANFREHELDGLVVIGGNGSLKGALRFYHEYGVPVAFVPASIDNDIGSTQFSLGFQTAVENALDACRKVRDALECDPRTYFVEVMGRRSGQIALALSLSERPDFVVIPEAPVSLAKLAKAVRQKRHGHVGKLVIVAEGARIFDHPAFVKPFPRPYQEASVSQVLSDVLKTDFDIVSRPQNCGYLLRGGAPAAVDNRFAAYCGRLSVIGLLEGRGPCVVRVRNYRAEIKPMTEALVRRTRRLNPGHLGMVRSFGMLLEGAL
jgi:6-phosphofructokinase 1